MSDNKELLIQIQELTTIADYRFKAITYALAKINSAKTMSDMSQVSKWSAELVKQEHALEMINASIELIQSRLTTGVIDTITTKNVPIQLKLDMPSPKPVTAPKAAIVNEDIKKATTKLKAEAIATPEAQREVKKEWGTDDSMTRSVYTMYKAQGKEKAMAKAVILFPDLFEGKKEEEAAVILDSLISKGKEIHEACIGEELAELYTTSLKNEEEARNIAKKIFSEEFEKFILRAREAGERMSQTRSNFDIEKFVIETSEAQFNKFLRAQLQQGEKSYKEALTEELRKEKSPKRNLVICTPDKINKITYWKDGGFNHMVFDSEGNEEDLVKATAIQLHIIGRTNEAISLLKEYYSNENWCNDKARQFLFELMREGEPFAELHATASTFILEALDKASTIRDKKAGKKVITKGEQKAKQFINAYFRTSNKNEDGSWVYAVDEKRMEKHFQTAKASAEAEFREMAKN